MTRFARLLRNVVERLVDRYYEGPRPPPRLAEEVRFFRLFRPLAPPDEWERFAVFLAQRAYRDGFVRGFEEAERSWPGPAVSPERIAEIESQDWSLAEEDARIRALLERAGSVTSTREAMAAQIDQAHLRVVADRARLVPGRRERR